MGWFHPLKMDVCILDDVSRENRGLSREKLIVAVKMLVIINLKKSLHL